MFIIPMSNGILSAQHRERIGSAVWEFMWCIDKSTRIDSSGFGLVLGGKPINLKDIAMQFGTAENTTSRNLNKLADEGYLILEHTAYGIRVKVANPKKRFKQNDKPRHINGEPTSRNDEAGSRNGDSNKTKQLYKTDYHIVRENRIVRVQSKPKEEAESSNNITPIKDEIKKDIKRILSR